MYFTVTKKIFVIFAKARQSFFVAILFSLQIYSVAACYIMYEEQNMPDFEINAAPFEILEEVAELILNGAVEVIGMMGYCQHGPEVDNMLSIYPMEEEMTSGKHDGEMGYALPYYDLEAILELFPDLNWGTWSTLDEELMFDIVYKGYDILVTLRAKPWDDNWLDDIEEA